jgi:hypothetical protein
VLRRLRELRRADARGVVTSHLPPPRVSTSVSTGATSGAGSEGVEGAQNRATATSEEARHEYELWVGRSSTRRR